MIIQQTPAAVIRVKELLKDKPDIVSSMEQVITMWFQVHY